MPPAGAGPGPGVLTPPPPRRAGSRRSPGRSRSVSMSSACVPMPTIVPRSSTMMRSACMMVLTRWATTNTVVSRHHRFQGRAQAGVGLEVEGREAVVQHQDLRPFHQRAGDGQALTLPAGDVGAPLGDGRLSPSAISATNSRPWAISSACHRSASSAELVAEAQVARPRCPRTGRPSAARSRSSATGRPAPCPGCPRRRSRCCPQVTS